MSNFNNEDLFNKHFPELKFSCFSTCSEGNTYLHFVNRNDGRSILTLAIDEVNHFLDVATGHLPPYAKGPTNGYKQSVIDRYYS